MNRRGRIAAISAMAVVVGLLVGGPVSARATVVQTKAAVAVDAALVDPCSLDLVSISGSIHLVTHVSFSSSKNANVGVHLNFQGLNGSGFPSGANYAGNGTAEMSAKVNGPFPAGFTMPGHFFLLRSGAGNDLKVSFLMKGKINANGTVTDLSFELRQLECGIFDLL